jgi:K+-sensing histidine kinase KdpD
VLTGIVLEKVVAWVLALRGRAGVVLTLSVLAPLAVCAAAAGLRAHVSDGVVVLLLVLCVVVAAASGRRLAPFVAAVSSGVFFDLFQTKPYGSLAISDTDDIELTVLLVVIGAVVTESVLWGLRQQARAARRSGYLDGALKAAEAAARGEPSRDALVRMVADQIRDVLGVPACRYVAGPVREDTFAVLQHDGSVTQGDRALGVDKEGLPIQEATVLIVPGGHFVITAASTLAFPTLEQRRVAVLLADLARSDSANASSW